MISYLSHWCYAIHKKEKKNECSIYLLLLTPSLTSVHNWWHRGPPRAAESCQELLDANAKQFSNSVTVITPHRASSTDKGFTVCFSVKSICIVLDIIALKVGVNGMFLQNWEPVPMGSCSLISPRPSTTPCLLLRVVNHRKQNKLFWPPTCFKVVTMKALYFSHILLLIV